MGGTSQSTRSHDDVPCAVLAASLEECRRRAAGAARRIAGGAPNDGDGLELIDAVYTALSIGSLALRRLRGVVPIDRVEHRVARARVRVALLRLAIPRESGTSRQRSAIAILDAFDDHAAQLVAALRGPGAADSRGHAASP